MAAEADAWTDAFASATAAATSSRVRGAEWHWSKQNQAEPVLHTKKANRDYSKFDDRKCFGRKCYKKEVMTGSALNLTTRSDHRKCSEFDGNN
eukprot:537095-Pelagomonas_calceolata.AAC.7